MEKRNHHQVVCFGEVLWDILPSGAVPGGAPMNVAYHLKKLGYEPALITKVGVDSPGQKLFDLMEQYTITTDYFQVDQQLPTGKVYASIRDNNEMEYDIVKPVAWDCIEWDESFIELVENAEFFVFGSLAARNKISKNTLFSLLEIAKKKVLDINLRAPHFNRRIVEDLLQKADFIKMNISELELITGWFSNYTGTEDRMKSLAGKFKISDMVVTMGGDGSILYMDGKIIRHPGFKITVADTVGSGDAFLAGLISKLLGGATPAEALEFAGGMGAFIATHTGACPEYDAAEITELISSNHQIIQQNIPS
ncbi:MAG: carbohydrate kinase [Ferruginibacter sp.]|nr:carbohydrate kinase [Ferruginibacter sp.]